MKKTYSAFCVLNRNGKKKQEVCFDSQVPHRSSTLLLFPKQLRGIHLPLITHFQKSQFPASPQTIICKQSWREVNIHFTTGHAKGVLPTSIGFSSHAEPAVHGGTAGKEMDYHRQ